MIVYTHFTYWLFTWYIVYIINQQFLGYTIPSPFWWLVLSACVNLVLLVYTLFLVSIGTLSNHKHTWLTIVLYIFVNCIIKVLPILSLQYQWFHPDERKNTRKMLYNSFLFGIGLLFLWLMWLSYNDRYMFNQKWWDTKKYKGILSNDGPLVTLLKNYIQS